MLRALSPLLALLYAAPAFAQSSDDLRERARERFDRAQLHYQEGRFREALDEYRAAYELVPHPDLLFNMGQCHRQLDDCERALLYYRQYLEASPQATNEQLVRELISECEKKERTRVEPPPPPLSPPPAPPPPIAPPTPAVTHEREVHIEETPIYGAWWFWTLIAAAALGAGVAAFVATRPEPVQPEPGTLGTFDWRINE